MCTLYSKDLTILEVQKNAGRMLPAVINNYTIHKSVKEKLKDQEIMIESILVQESVTPLTT